MRVSFQISSILVALLFVFTINFNSMLTFNYFINQAEITELFCINKEKPTLACNGKCYLMQEFNKVENNKTENPFSENSIVYNLEIKPIVQNNTVEFNNFDQVIPLKYFYTSIKTIEQSFTIQSPPPRA